MITSNRHIKVGKDFEAFEMIEWADVQACNMCGCVLKKDCEGNMQDDSSNTLIGMIHMYRINHV